MGNVWRSGNLFEKPGVLYASCVVNYRYRFWVPVNTVR